MTNLKTYYLIGSNKEVKVDTEITDWRALAAFESDSDWPEPTQIEPCVKRLYSDHKHVQLVDENFLVYYYLFKFPNDLGWLRLFPIPKHITILGKYIGAIVGVQPANGFYPYKNNQIKSLEF